MVQKLELQLLPGTKKRLGVKVPGENRFLYVGSAILGAVLVATLVLTRYRTSLENQIAKLNGQLIAIEQSRDKNKEADLLTTKNQVLLATQIVDNHVYWSKSLSIVTGLMQSQVRFKSIYFSLTPKSQVSIEAVAINFTVVARQIAAFYMGEGITSVTLGKISASPNGYIEFGLTLDFDKAPFINKKK